ncbi:MAG: sugar fermentation stimulation protein A [Pseudohongiellaceae bacterium]|jgi:sugar fermentation stimulation protein A
MGSMKFQPALIEATLIKRYKRFLADVRLADGTTATAHCANTGRMTGCCEPGATVMLSAAKEGRKLPYTWRLVRVGRCWVSVDTGLPNTVVADSLRQGRIPELAGYDTVKTEVRYGLELRSRIDVLLTDSKGEAPPCYVEVKNVTLREGRRALFPDAVSTRALKHLHELAREVERGNRAVLVLFVARSDCDSFGAAPEIDPDWSRALVEVADAGVEIMPWQARIDRNGVTLGQPLPWVRD